MENRNKQATSDTSPTTSDNHRRPTRSPEHSPDSSLSSDTSSLSHGFSPREENLPPLFAPKHNPSTPPSPVLVPMVNRYVHDEPVAPKKVESRAGAVEEGGGGGGRRLRPDLSILRRRKRETMVKKAALGFRVFGCLFCLISLSVMAADKNQGWALDSFNRYKEFRYCIAVNVIGFVYSAVQGCDLAYHLATGKYVIRHQLRYYLDFAIDQMLTYLLISASSSGATRIDDWQSNWGKDKFPEMATASVGMSFLAFVAFATSSLISGYALCTSKTV